MITRGNFHSATHSLMFPSFLVLEFGEYRNELKDELSEQYLYNLHCIKEESVDNRGEHHSMGRPGEHLMAFLVLSRSLEHSMGTRFCGIHNR